MVRAYYLQTSEQIRMYLVLWMRAAGIWLRRHASQFQYSHQLLYPLASVLIPFTAQEDFHLSAAVKRLPCVF